ncbi:MAG: hypothetical protein EA360_03795 [Balneolaceae bacterium]|nr:MAG: hypothetical protein EA360_03795 [Balneolaceae bacterium]
MSSSEKDRERLKEEYKDHYRKIRETKEKFRRAGMVQNVNQALQRMNSDELLSSVDHFLGNVRDKMSHIEAKIDVAMDDFMSRDTTTEELDEELKREKARNTLKKIKREMGLLYSDIEKQARELNTSKTVGTARDADGSEEANEN